MGRWTISVFGPLHVHDQTTGAAVDIRRDATRRVLALLTLAGGRRISTDTLIDQFWNGSPPTRAKGALQTHISAVRRLLGADVILTEGHGYALNLDVVDIDADRLPELASTAGSQRAARAWSEVLDSSAAARALPAGQPFDDIDDDLAGGTRAALNEHRIFLDEVGVEALVELGRPEAALPLAETMVHERPLRERSWELLAAARAATGRHIEALRSLNDARATLAEAGLVPGPGLRRVEQQILLAQQERPPSGLDNLPSPLTTFVGRTDELGAIAGSIETHRLVTMTGVGGTGKSRLALEVARRLMTSRPDLVDECWFVELASERDPAAIPARVASSIGLNVSDSDVDGASTVAAAIGARRCLLVLDNCEHLVEAVADFVHRVVAAGPAVRVVATSRVPLQVTGELLYEVPTLALPPATDAVQLFLDRARLSRPDQEFTESELDLVAELCRSLDGLPLAIELAAGRLRSLSLSAIIERVGDRFGLLTGGRGSANDRHRTMQAAIAWSHDLLEPSERDLLEQLAVFRGRVTLDDIAEVCGLDPTGLDERLGALVDHSLVRMTNDHSTVNYHLLETVREFAWSRLDDDRRDALIAAHRDRFATRARELRLFWLQPAERRIQPTALDWWVDVGLSLDDVRAALDRAREAIRNGSDVDGISDLAGLLAHVAAAGVRHHEAVGLLDIALRSGTGRQLGAVMRSLLATELSAIDQVERAAAEIDAAVDAVSAGPPSLAKLTVLSRAALMAFSLPDRTSASALPLALQSREVADEVGLDIVSTRVQALVATSLARANRGREASEELGRLLTMSAQNSDPSSRVLAIVTAFNVVYIGDVDRRHGAVRYIDEAQSLIDRHPEAVTADLGFWLIFALLQQGRYDDCEAVIAKLAPVEGYETTGTRTVWARLLWMSGRLDEATAMIAPTMSGEVDRFWESNLYATAAEIAAARGDLDLLTGIAARYLTPSELPTFDALKIATFRPLVQGHVDTALMSTGTVRSDHVVAARAATRRMHEIGDALPHEALATTQLERWTTFAAIADAELRRLGPADAEVAAWEAIAELPDTAWYRGYVDRRRRNAEARHRG